MHKQSRMTQTPMQCLYCGRGNTPDDPDSMDEFWVIDLERDVNWGDPTYLCKYCVNTIAAIAGHFTNEDVTAKDNVIQHQLRRIHDLEAKLAVRQRRLDEIATGRRAVRQVRADADKKVKGKKKVSE